MSELAKQLDPYLETTLTAVRSVEQFLGPEDDWVEDDRRIVFEAAQRLSDATGGWHNFVKEKTTDEYLFTVRADSDTVENVLMENGPYQRNVLSNRKYRTDHDVGKQWACGSVVHDPTDKYWQHHVYIFEAPSGNTDIYTHIETSVRKGSEHLTGVHRDATKHVLPDVFDSVGLEYGRRQI